MLLGVMFSEVELNLVPIEKSCNLRFFFHFGTMNGNRKFPGLMCSIPVEQEAANQHTISLTHLVFLQCKIRFVGLPLTADFSRRACLVRNSIIARLDMRSPERMYDMTYKTLLRNVDRSFSRKRTLKGPLRKHATGGRWQYHMFAHMGLFRFLSGHCECRIGLERSYVPMSS